MFNPGVTIPETNISFLIREKLFLINPSEISFVQTSIFECLNFLILKKKIKLSSAFNNGYVYRTGILRSGNAIDGFMPISKALAGNCGNVYSETEAIWFSKEILPRYMTQSMNLQDPFGLLSCRKLKNIDTQDNSLLAFINLSTRTSPICSRNNAVLLSKSIQTYFNKCLLHSVVRRYSSYGNTYPYTIQYQDIIDYQDSIIIDLNVEGYQCDPRYTSRTTCIRDVLNSWNYQTGERDSRWKPDRIQIDSFFIVLDIMNSILYHYGNSIINNSYKEEYPHLTFIKILGWTCEDTPRTRDCSTFPGEIAIAIKYLKKPVRYGIFKPQSETCKPRFYQKNQFFPDEIQEVTRYNQYLAQYLVGYPIGGKKQMNIKNSDLILLDDTPKKNKLPELSAIELEINQLFVPSLEEEKLYTSEDKKISDFFSNIIEKEKFEIEKEEDSIGGKKNRDKSRKRNKSKAKSRKRNKSKAKSRKRNKSI
jgi:hypothetical protein